MGGGRVSRCCSIRTAQTLVARIGWFERAPGSYSGSSTMAGTFDGPSDSQEVSVPSSITRFTQPACMRDRRLSEEKSSGASQRDAKIAMNIHEWLSASRILSTLAARYHILAPPSN